MKTTPQRTEIARFLKRARNHPSALEIYGRISQKFPNMSFATVYNNLKMLAEKGRIKTLDLDPQKTRFDPDVSKHHHIICLKCGKIEDIRRKYRIKTAVPKKCRYTALSNTVHFYGICAGCKKKSGRRRTKKTAGGKNK
ncbi:MAG: transcriptional repressor [Elusimicrobia bacterium]|nr:transcriptional repressor [Elusimicrobiota bacterium]